MTALPQLSKRKYLAVTSLMDFVRCPRRYFFKKSGLVPHTPAPALLYGTAIHKAAPEGVMHGIEAGIIAFDSVWDEEIADDKRNRARALKQLAHFVFTHTQGRSLYTFDAPPEGCRHDELTSPLEIAGFVDIGLPVPLYVRMDGWVTHRDTGRKWGWELKTVSNWPPGSWNKVGENLEFHPQVLTYTMCLRTLTNIHIEGIMTEAILIDKAKVDNMTHPILVPDHLVEDIHRWLTYWGSLLLGCEERALEAGDWVKGVEFFIKNFTGCTPYAHYYTPSYLCDFSNLCRLKDFTQLLDIYDIKPDHQDKLTELTIGEG